MINAFSTNDDLNLAQLVYYVDAGRDYTPRIIWRMNRKRYMRENASSP